MAEHYCPMCGLAHDEPEALGDSPSEEVAVEVAAEQGDVAETAVEAMRDVAVAAVESNAAIVAEQEETDRVEAMTDMVETVAEEASEVAIADEVGEAANDQETGDPEEPVGDEPEPEEPEEEGPETEGEEEGEEEATHDEEPTPVSVPPQLSEEAGGQRRPKGRPVSSWQRNRARGRRR